VYAASPKLDEEQHVEPFGADRVDREEIAGDHRRRVGTDELSPAQPGPLTSRSEAGELLARRKRPVSLDDLAERDWVLFGPDHGLSELILGVCARAGFTPRRTVQTSQVAAAAHLAAAGLGVTIVPSNVVPAGLNAEVRRLRPPLARQLVAFGRQDWSPLAQAFLDVLRSQPWESRPRSAQVIP
jgi:DNA-binding transcriptional LysR family regulator